MSKRSPIWKIPVPTLQKAVASSLTLTEALENLGLKKNGNQYSTLKKVLRAHGIGTSHFPEKYGRTISANRAPATPLEEIMVENSTYNRGWLKARLLSEKVLPYVCQGTKCGMDPEWFGKPLVLVLDHINGKNNDHRKENLQFLCPNCNSQTSTFSGRNRAQAKACLCEDCGKPRSRGAKRCRNCAAAERHVSRPRP